MRRVGRCKGECVNGAWSCSLSVDEEKDVDSDR
jgi:hypothetical protein